MTAENTKKSISMARKARNMLEKSTEKNKAIVTSVKQELLEHKMRLTQLEALELEKLEQETRLKEELMSNHGK